jgi:orotidine-5'-phosphate decarboxylase
MKEKVVIALDVSSREQALHSVRELHDLCGMFKIGSQLFMAVGAPIVREIIDLGGRVFLDLKFHDIPNTVVRAASEAAKLGVSMMTLHASGGRAMMRAVSDDLHERFGHSKPIVVAVTVLTSLDTRALFEIGIEQPVDHHVRRLTELADACGMDGVVCSPHELPLLRGAVRPGFKLVTPGIRLPDQSANDQHRISTPAQAIADGADFIVIGRAVTDDRDPRSALSRLLESL